MSRRTEIRPWWQHAAGAALLAAMALQAFGRGARIPILGWLDLAIHEAGHVLTMFLPEVANAMMGNGFQTLVPLSLAGVFVLKERDWLGAVLCLGWAATTMQDASVYIADAPYQRLQLIGGYHDWAYALAELDALASAGAIARAVWTAGLLLMLLTLVGAVAGPWWEQTFIDGGVRGLVAPAAQPVAPAPSRSGVPSPADGPDEYFAGWRG